MIEILFVFCNHTFSEYLYFNFVCEGRSRLEYCLESADKSLSPFPCPALAGSNVGLAAVVIFPNSQESVKNTLA